MPDWCGPVSVSELAGALVGEAVSWGMERGIEEVWRSRERGSRVGIVDVGGLGDWDMVLEEHSLVVGRVEEEGGGGCGRWGGC